MRVRCRIFFYFLVWLLPSFFHTQFRKFPVGIDRPASPAAPSATVFRILRVESTSAVCTRYPNPSYTNTSFGRHIYSKLCTTFLENSSFCQIAWARFATGTGDATQCLGKQTKKASTQRKKRGQNCRRYLGRKGFGTISWTKSQSLQNFTLFFANSFENPPTKGHKLSSPSLSLCQHGS